MTQSALNMTTQQADPAARLTVCCKDRHDLERGGAGGGCRNGPGCSARIVSAGPQTVVCCPADTSGSRFGGLSAALDCVRSPGKAVPQLTFSGRASQTGGSGVCAAASADMRPSQFRQPAMITAALSSLLLEVPEVDAPTIKRWPNVGDDQQCHAN